MDCDIILLKHFIHARRSGLWRARLRSGIELLGEVGACRWRSRFSRASSESKKPLQEVIFRGARWQGHHEARITRGSRCPVCIEIPIVMDYVKYSAKISGFSSL